MSVIYKRIVCYRIRWIRVAGNDHYGKYEISRRVPGDVEKNHRNNSGWSIWITIANSSCAPKTSAKPLVAADLTLSVPS
jgi:hypothetical protein